MTEGMVNAAYEPVARLSVQGPSDQTGEIEAVIDAGFTVSLTVTPALAAELELDFRGTGRATLSDRSEVTFLCYGVVVLWDGQPLYVEADASDTAPLGVCDRWTGTVCTWKPRSAGGSYFGPGSSCNQPPNSSSRCIMP